MEDEAAAHSTTRQSAEYSGKNLNPPRACHDALTALTHETRFFHTLRGADNAQLLGPKIVMRSFSFITAGPTTRGGEEDSGVRKEK